MSERAVGTEPESFTFSVGHAAVACRVDRALAGVIPSFVQADGASALATPPALLVSVERGRPVSPASRGLSPTCVFGDTSGYGEQGTLELWDGRSLVAADLGGRAVTAAVAPESELHVVGSVMLFVGVALALRAHGLFHLHAGCVETPGLGTVLIVGESGAGKTTLTLGLAALGGRLVSDDAVFLAKGLQDGALISGWPADLHLSPPTLAAFPTLAVHAYREVCDGRAKRAVPLSALPAPWLPTARRPRLVLFPAVANTATSSVRALDAKETVARLIPQSGLALVPGAARCDEHLNLLANIAGDAVGLEVALGADALPPGLPLLELLKAAAKGG